MAKQIVPISEIQTNNVKILQEIANTGAKHLEIRIIDPRSISSDQQRKARAIIRDIGRWSGHPPDYLHDFLKYDFCTKYEIDFFSLSDIDVTTARQYITYLLDFCLHYDVPLKNGVLDLLDDIQKTLYICLKRKKCILCGLKTELHHVEKVGMGRNRNKIVHEGLEVQPLCAIHHQECHNMGQASFDSKHHLEALPLDKYLCIMYGLGYEAS